jgi:hypothetical protein
MFKKIVIKVLKLNNISDLLLKAKQKQKAVDDKYWKEVLQKEKASIQQEYDLELQEKDSTICMLEDHLASYKKREKEISAEAYKAKKQIKENFFVVGSVVTKMKDFNNNVNAIYGEMLGIRDSVDRQRKKLENDNK